MANRKTLSAMILGLAFCLWVTASCSDGALVEQSLEPPSPRELASRAVDQLLFQFETRVDETALQYSRPADLAQSIESNALLEQAHPRYPEILQSVYSQLQYAPIMVTQGELTESGRLVTQQLRDAWVHGLRPEKYGILLVEALLEDLERASTLIADFAIPALSQDEIETLTTYIAERPMLLQLESGDLQQHLNELLMTPDGQDHPPLPRVTSELVRYFEALSAFEQAQVDLEIALALGFFMYAYDMRYFNPVWLEEYDDDHPDRLAPLVRPALSEVFLQGAGEEGFAPVFERLYPAYQQYTRLVEAHRRYRAIATHGGWDTVEYRPLSLGREYDEVPALRRRLNGEGYFEGDLESRQYDRPLRDALIHYQQTHQFSDNGEMTESLVRSLNTTALYRAQQIALALQRWRESQIGPANYYVFVNVPDFHVEVWRDGQRDMRFRAIVGSTERVRRRDTGEMVYARATPEIHRPLRYVVFNPYWNVPPEIMINEYDPFLEEDPKWYEHNGYQVMYNEDGSRWVRQLPGPDNALGLVKFLFPNAYDVYMHDTPHKNLFERTLRTFSHGCIRIENPMAFAEYLLENDRGWDRERIDRERESGLEQWVSLRHPVPVHVEYYVVRIDDDGFAHFFSDLYRRDQPRIQELIREELRQAVAGANRQVARSLDAALRCTISRSPSESCARLETSPDEETQSVQ